MFEQVCIIGLGLIGASLAQAIRDRNLAQRMVAVDSHAASIEAALNEAVIDAGSNRLADVIAGSDCAIIAVPVKAVAAVFADIHAAMQQGLIKPDCLISDVCSTKQIIVDAAKQAFDTLPCGFVPAHPIAGAEHSGFHARRAHLFDNHNLIVCELESTDKAAIDKITALWEAVGATVMMMEVAHHDAVLAYTSHLPHLLAFNLVEQLASHDDNMDIFRYAAGGFRDFTRIAASDPIMWHDIFIANKPALLKALDEYSSYLSKLRSIIDNEDSTQLLGLLGRAKTARRHFGHMLTGTPYTKQLADNGDDVLANTSQQFIITPSKSVQGVIAIPGDKSISHRSIMLGSLAEGITTVKGFLDGEDALATLQAFRDMGVTIEGPDNGEVVIHGVGKYGLKPSHTPLYMGNSGTSMRLLSGILAAQPFDSVLTGDSSLSKRPMERVAKPLRDMGAIIQTTGAKGTAPISISGRLTKDAKHSEPLQGIVYDMPVASAQVKSCLLLAGLWAKGTTTIIQPNITRDHTERMLSAFGYDVNTEGDSISITGGGVLRACDMVVPADISSAAFFIVAASIAKDSELTLAQVGINPTRSGVIDILTLMGANITLSNETFIGGEPVADITVRSAALKGIDIPEYLVPLAIDEFPVLFIAASCAVGRTVLTGAKELKVKESDRIAVMAEGLTTLGVQCQVTEDGIIIEGKGTIDGKSTINGKGNELEERQDGYGNSTFDSNKINPSIINSSAIFTGGKIASYHDHRIAMSFAVASLRASDTLIIEGVETVNTSFPKFDVVANKIGMNIAIQHKAIKHKAINGK